MKKKILTMQIVNKHTSQIIPNFIDTSQPLHKIEQKLNKILKNTRVDEWSGSKLIVTGENEKWDEITHDCIFVEEHEGGNTYHFGCFASSHPWRYLIRKTYKTLKGAIDYLPNFS